MDAERNKSVLVVDDNDTNLLILTTMLGRLGFTVDEAKSGMDAISHTCRKTYDLIFMDHLMPEMDGVETVKQIFFLSSGEKRPTVIGVSATIDKEVSDAFLSVGVGELLEKPVTMDKLEEKLRFLGVFGDDGIEGAQDGVGGDIGGILSEVQGLDYKKGLDMMAGSVDNYMKVLSVCIKNIMDNYNSIEMLKENAGPESFALYFHSLKGIFLNIGADVMARKSKGFEMAAKEGRMPEINAGLEPYLQEVLSFQKALKAAYGQYSASQDKKVQGKEVSDSEFARDLEQLRQHIEDFEYMEITEMLEKMQPASQGAKKEKLEKIAAAIQDFEYDEALRLADALRDEL